MRIYNLFVRFFCYDFFFVFPYFVKSSTNHNWKKTFYPSFSPFLFFFTKWALTRSRWSLYVQSEYTKSGVLEARPNYLDLAMSATPINRYTQRTYNRTNRQAKSKKKQHKRYRRYREMREYFFGITATAPKRRLRYKFESDQIFRNFPFYELDSANEKYDRFLFFVG